MNKPRILLVRLTPDGRLDIDETDKENEFAPQSQPYLLHWILTGANLRDAQFEEFSPTQVGVRPAFGSRPWPFATAKALNNRVLVLQNKFDNGDPPGYWVYQLGVVVHGLHLTTTYDQTLVKARSGKSRFPKADDDCCNRMTMRISNNPIIINR